MSLLIYWYSVLKYNDEHSKPSVLACFSSPRSPSPPPLPSNLTRGPRCLCCARPLLFAGLCYASSCLRAFENALLECFLKFFIHFIQSLFWSQLRCCFRRKFPWCIPCTPPPPMSVRPLAAVSRVSALLSSERHISFPTHLVRICLPCEGSTATKTEILAVLHSSVFLKCVQDIHSFSNATFVLYALVILQCAKKKTKVPHEVYAPVKKERHPCSNLSEWKNLTKQRSPCLNSRIKLALGLRLFWTRC